MIRRAKILEIPDILVIGKTCASERHGYTKKLYDIFFPKQSGELFYYYELLLR